MACNESRLALYGGGDGCSWWMFGVVDVWGSGCLSWWMFWVVDDCGRGCLCVDDFNGVEFVVAHICDGGRT